MAAAREPEVEVVYWPAVGRTLGFRLMLEDAQVPYKRTMYLGGELAPSVAAVPYIKYDGMDISQSQAIMEAVADICGYMPPASMDNKSRQTSLNIADIVEQTMNKRKEDVKTMEDCAAFTDSRVKQFFVAIEAGFSLKDSTFFCGERPTMVDFQLLTGSLHLNTMLGACNMNKLLKAHCPNTNKALKAMWQRPNIVKWITGGFGGEPFYPDMLAGICAVNTPYANGKKKLFMKAGCPFCSKLAGFLAEAGLLQHVEFQPDDPAARAYVTAKCGKASFPALEVEPGQVMLESGDIIDKFAKEYNVDVSNLPVYNFVFEQSTENNTMMKSFTKLFKMGMANAGGYPELFKELEKY